VLGLYQLQGRIAAAFPHILLENCASGGGRFDPGMLFFSPQIWCSDNTDALVRMKIQVGPLLRSALFCVLVPYSGATFFSHLSFVHRPSLSPPAFSHSFFLSPFSFSFQYGSSLHFPTRSIGAHVSVTPNHMTGQSFYPSHLFPESFLAYSSRIYLVHSCLFFLSLSFNSLITFLQS
jgi:hypothetical protein